MATYKIILVTGKNNECLYPDAVAGVVWKSVAYNIRDGFMIGETDEDIEADNIQVFSLTPEEFNKQSEKIAPASSDGACDKGKPINKE